MTSSPKRRRTIHNLLKEAVKRDHKIMGGRTITHLIGVCDVCDALRLRLLFRLENSKRRRAARRLKERT